MDIQTIALAFFVTVAAGGVVWVFVYPFLSGERKAEKRVETVAKPDPGRGARSARTQQKSRREQVEETLKDLELRQKKLEESARFRSAFRKPASTGRSRSSF